MMNYPSLEEIIGNTPIVRLRHLPARYQVADTVNVLAKLEGHNPGGSVKDRAALAMILAAEQKGLLKPGDRLIEASSGNTGIALAMAACLRGYKITIVMPDNLSQERRDVMTAYGADIVLTPAAQGGMELARDTAQQLQAQGKGIILNQFANPANPQAHIMGTGPEIWQQTQGTITHFVSAMGTTGTIMGTSTYLKQQNPAIQIIGVQPSPGAQITGIRKWSKGYEPEIYDAEQIDRLEYVEQQEAEVMTRQLAQVEGIFAGVSSGGALVAALRVAASLKQGTVLFIVCDRGDRYVSSGLFQCPKSA